MLFFCVVVLGAVRGQATSAATNAALSTLFATLGASSRGVTDFCRHSAVNCTAGLPTRIELVNEVLPGRLAFPTLVLPALASLSALVVRDARLTGTIPVQLNQLSKLTFLDLSGNELSAVHPNVSTARLLHLRLSRNLLALDATALFHPKLTTCDLQAGDDLNCVSNCPPRCCVSSSGRHCLAAPPLLVQVRCAGDGIAASGHMDSIGNIFVVGAPPRCVADPVPAVSDAAIQFDGESLLNVTGPAGTTPNGVFAAEEHSHMLWLRLPAAAADQFSAVVFSSMSTAILVDGLALVFGTAESAIKLAEPLVADRWYHVVAQRRESDLRMFIDCDVRSRCPQADVNDVIGAVSAFATTCQLSIAGVCAANKLLFRGHIDDYRFYAGVIEPLHIGVEAARQVGVALLDTESGTPRGAWLPVVGSKMQNRVFGRSAQVGAHSAASAASFTWTTQAATSGMHLIEIWHSRNATFGRALVQLVVDGNSTDIDIEQEQSGVWVEVTRRSWARGAVVALAIHGDSVAATIGADAMRIVHLQPLNESTPVPPTATEPFFSAPDASESTIVIALAVVLPLALVIMIVVIGRALLSFWRRDRAVALSPYPAAPDQALSETLPKTAVLQVTPVAGTITVSNSAYNGAHSTHYSNAPVASFGAPTTFDAATSFGAVSLPTPTYAVVPTHAPSEHVYEQPHDAMTF